MFVDQPEWLIELSQFFETELKATFFVEEVAVLYTLVVDARW